jgi:hypothetical protein
MAYARKIALWSSSIIRVWLALAGLLKGGRLVCGRGIQFWEMNAITRIQSSPYAVRGILGEQSY